MEMVECSAEEMQSILIEIINRLEDGDNSERLAAAKSSAGNEMLKMMQEVFPVVLSVEADVLRDRGFASNRNTLLNFTACLVKLQKSDPQLARLHQQIRSHFLPPVTVTSMFDAPS